MRNQAGEVLLRFNDVYETGPPYAEGLLRINEAGVAIGDPLTALILGCSLAVQNGRIGRSSGGYSAD